MRYQLAFPVVCLALAGLLLLAYFGLVDVRIVAAAAFGGASLVLLLMGRHGDTRQSKARRGRAGRGTARRGSAGLGEARHGLSNPNARN